MANTNTANAIQQGDPLDAYRARIAALESALRSILKESGITRFDDVEPTGTIETIAYIVKAAL
jgi:phosphatidylserine/phosphatidylglycerophosphate/cardiolipin synthase-like enzyme